MAGSTPPPVSGNAPAPLNAADPRKLGKYVITGRLGQGGMGTVFLGHSPDGDAVAIKVIKPELAERPEFRARFRREAESARRVRRFTTAAVLDADPDGPWPYLVTEYVEGPTLSKLVARRGPMRPADLEQMALSVATALSAIHAAGIVHRDLTPANVLLSPVGPKVIDFGLARDFEGSGEFSRTAKHAIGTPGYMAPEQIMDSPVTSAADVFAWGAITVFAATGRQPFGEGRIEALLFRILYEPANIDGVPDELAPLVDAALRKNPAERPTAEELRISLMSGAALPAARLAASGPAAQEATSTDSKDGARRRRGHLFGRGRHQDGDEAVSGAPLSGAATSLLTPAPATTVAPRAPISAPPTSVGPAAPVAPAPRSVPAPSVAPGGPVARSAGPQPPSLAPRSTTSTPPRSPAPLSTPGPAPRTPVPHPSAPPPATTPSPTPVSPAPAAPIRPQAAPAGERAAAMTARVAPPARPAEEARPSGAGRGRRTVVLVAAGLVLLAAAVGIPLAVTHGSGGNGGSSSVSPARAAQLSDTLAKAADSARPTDPARAARLSLAAYRIAPTQAAAGAMIASFAASSKVDLPGSPVAYTGVALTADGRLGAATDAAGRVRLWNLAAATPALLADIATGDASAPTAPVFLPTGDLLTGGGIGHAWTLTDPRAPRAISDVKPQATQPLQLALSGDGRLLVTAGQDRIIELWDLNNPAKPGWLGLKVTPGIITDIALSPDGRTLAVSGVDGTVSLWDLSDRRNPVERGSAVGHLGQVTSVAFLPGSKRIVTGGSDKTVRLWNVTDLNAPRQLGEVTQGSSPVVNVAAVDSNLVVSSDASGSLLGWSIDAANPADSFSLGRGSTGLDLAVGGAGKMLLTAPAGGSSGAASLISTDPARLATVACANPANRIGETEWKSLVADLAYSDPCAGR
ncbi:protein kinase [Frankia sp. AgB1.9]|uniref:WD40 repeat domain-containing serine/threonine protein kinase n=1 Tax=unclassified Frankia TaxID=2632575 RepID=UPI0019335B4A|nr:MULTISPECIES: serine/threonine-protein kinase [unclassified Frankia]MBL7490453.1 protein kinase [Frankia sp. AgW1.1]MBL7548235.1 protein kinase [Frankia sp. AgB1.9]MBL7617848.1 protein kinase [Frankia sp. AgB1.8]